MPHVAMLPATTSRPVHVPSARLTTVYVRMKDRSGTVALDLPPTLRSPKELIVRFHDVAFGKAFVAFAAHASLWTRRRGHETRVTTLHDVHNGDVVIYQPCDELRMLLEQGCVTPVLALHNAAPVDHSPARSPLGLKRKGRAKSVTHNVERVHRYASDLAHMDVSPREKEWIHDLLIVGDEQVVDAMEQFVVHRNPALVRRVLRGPADKKKHTAIETLSMTFSSLDMDAPTRSTSGEPFEDPFLRKKVHVSVAATDEARSPVETVTGVDGVRPSLVLDGDALATTSPLFLQPIQEKGTPPSGRMSLALLHELDPSTSDVETPTHLFMIEKLLDNVPVGRNFHDQFTLGPVLGTGKYSVVKHCTKHATGDEFAVKVIDKRLMMETRFLKRELEIMYALRHDGIVRLLELYEDKECVFLVMERCGQELFEHIDTNGPLLEASARPLIWKLVATVAYLHAQCIVHRDIKPENILLPVAASDDLSAMKLSDFGIARKLEGHDPVLTPHESLSEVTTTLHDAPGATTTPSGLPSATDSVRNRMARAHTKCGTRDYIAPEVMSGKGYGTEADLWSVGVVTYVLVSGCAPMFLPTSDGVKKVFFPDEAWSSASEALKAFIEALLVREPEQRITAAEALNHPWLSTD
ncbi:hypothetical protein PsorP6_015943 [Peronosclerospora sorghi]|uniref:Uncharacterized protein n=1 Tax=Peronosclerospora sorghi TaxID=230839 RepID=A0ACC0WPQ5_9STRA|nr:hypothetical protein PsorP6_015943 [Peronosclerospora sorghi]